MNNPKDFHKKPSGIVVNNNSRDFKRAKNRNYIKREQDKIIGENGKVSVLEKEISELKSELKALIKMLKKEDK